MTCYGFLYGFYERRETFVTVFGGLIHVLFMNFNFLICYLGHLFWEKKKFGKARKVFNL